MYAKKEQGPECAQNVCKALAEKSFNLDAHGLLAFIYCGEILPLTICHSGAGYYIGTTSATEGPTSRESTEYWTSKSDAEKALASGNWVQRANP
jgi:hypothetical protein